MSWEKKQRVIALMVVMVALIAMRSEGQTVCNASVSSLEACEPAATPPNPPPPTQECCAALSHADFACLCTYKNDPLLPSLGIDPKLAFQVPVKCNLPPPPC
ncbi:hypothetical protein VNO77_34382 [Canavalia gladiata]|uniref:Bifunctional inhibitor/plant lipid transfer protein/seed storage helical domain-containing protein n=1 Tax=Canavalia gladiata TaxID=3824 RepID=A0AAN9KHF8_CANGL